jgi:hypothetical protein
MASSSLSNQQSQQFMDYLLKGVALPSLPGSLWLALFTTTPNLNGVAGVEVSTSGTGYTRVELPRVSGTWTGPTGTNQEYNNTVELIFPVPTGNWGAIVSLGIYDSASNGNLIFISTIATSKSISIGDGSPRLTAGSLKILRAIC